MNKQEFLSKLRSALSGLPKDEVEERMNFYEEMIDDRMEDGVSEEEAVAAAGDVDGIAKKALSEVPMSKIMKERITPKSEWQPWEILLLVLGFPLWFPLLIAAGVLVLALYVVILSLDISLWAGEIGLWGGAIGGIVIAVLYGVNGFGVPALAMLGIGLISAGVSIFWFYICIAATKGLFRLCGMIAIGIKKLFIKKENTK